MPKEVAWGQEVVVVPVAVVVKFVDTALRIGVEVAAPFWSRIILLSRPHTFFMKLTHTIPSTS